MKRIAFVLTVLAAAAYAPAEAAAAAALRSDVLYLLPQESGEVAFVDLQALRGSPHYFLIKQRLVPPRFAAFDQFLRPLGVDVDRDLEWLAWVLVPPGPGQPNELFLGLAQGQFTPEKIEQFFFRQKLALEAYRGQTLFPLGSRGEAQGFFFAFLDSSTAAFGTRAGLELLLETRFGAHENLTRNEALVERLHQVNGHVPIWAVFDQHYTRLAVRQLLPEAAAFEQFGLLADRFRSSALRLNLEREARVSFYAWCAESADALVFSLLLETGLMAQSWRVKKTNPALSSVLGRAEVRTAGEGLEVRLAIAEKDVRAILEPLRPL